MTGGADRAAGSQAWHSSGCGRHSTFAAHHGRGEGAWTSWSAGDPVSSEKAKELGLVDEIVSGDLRAAAISYANRLLTDGQGVRRASQLTARSRARRRRFLPARANASAKAWRGYPAPLAIVRLCRGGDDAAVCQGCDVRAPAIRETGEDRRVALAAPPVFCRAPGGQDSRRAGGYRRDARSSPRQLLARAPWVAASR